MIADLPELNRLPRHTASDVKNRWRDLVQEVRTAGSVAVTNHAKVELVLVDAETYSQLAASAAALREREQALLEQLSAQFQERLATLQAPDAHDKVSGVFGRKGQLTKRPVAGGSY